MVTATEWAKTTVRRLPWWDVLFVGVPAVAVAAVFLWVTLEPERWSGAVAVGSGLVALVPIVWSAFARRWRGPTVRGYAAFAVIALLLTVAITLVPLLGIVQALLYPYLWMTFQRTRRSVGMSFVVAGVIGLATVLYWGPTAVPGTLFVQVMSVLMSVGIGLSITTAWTVADERQQLLDELTRAQAQVRELSRQSGISLERERLSRELHDTLAQTLAGLSLLAERAARGARRAVETGAGPEGAGSDAQHDPRSAPDGAAGHPLAATLTHLDQIAELAKTALGETRALIAESAPVHDGSGTTFTAAIDRLAERFRRETGVRVAVDLGPDASAVEAIGRDEQVVLLRCLQETLANIRRYADATAATVRLCAGPGPVVLAITDDGRGFDPERIDGTGFGLPGLRDRARLLDGSVEVDSAPGRGTTITVRLPGTPATTPRTEAS